MSEGQRKLHEGFKQVVRRLVWDSVGVCVGVAFSRLRRSGKILQEGVDFSFQDLYISCVCFPVCDVYSVTIQDGGGGGRRHFLSMIRVLVVPCPFYIQGFSVVSRTWRNARRVA